MNPLRKVLFLKIRFAPTIKKTYCQQLTFTNEGQKVADFSFFDFSEQTQYFSLNITVLFKDYLPNLRRKYVNIHKI
jgi:hypothetical protein